MAQSTDDNIGCKAPRSVFCGEFALFFNPHRGLGRQLKVADHRTDEGNLGGSPITHRGTHAAPGRPAAGERNVAAAGEESRRAGGGALGGVGRGVDGCLTNSLTRCVHDQHLVASEEAKLDEGKEEDGEERKSEGQLDCGLTLALPRCPRLHFTLPRTLFMTVSRSLPMRSVLVAEPLTSRATAAAPKSTRAYSAVAWPRSVRCTRWARVDSDR